MSFEITNPFPLFTDLNGLPLENGNIFIGVVNLNPETNPVSVFFDEAQLIPALQPIRTIAGYPSNAGTPANLFVADLDLSITVRNKKNEVVFSDLDANKVARLTLIDASTLVNIAAMTALLKANLTDGMEVNVSGYTTQADGGGDRFYWNDTDSTTTIDNVLVFGLDVPGVGRFFRIIDKSQPLSIIKAGAITGSADNTVAIQAALTTGLDVTGPAGTFITTKLTMTSNQKLFGKRGFTIKLKDSSDVDLIDFGTATSAAIRGLTLDGNKANQTVNFDAVVIRGDGTTSCKVSRARIINSTLSGINVRNSFGFKVLFNLFEDCGTMNNGVDPGDAVYLAFNEDDLVLGNRVLRCARIGFVLKGQPGSDSKGGRIINNYIRDAGQNAISTEDGSQHFIISGNVIDTTGINTASTVATGIACGEYSVNGNISNNIIVDAGRDGIGLPNGPTNVIVHDNEIINAVSSGILALSSDARGGINNLQVVNNKIISCGLDGIFIVAATTGPLKVGNLNRNIIVTGNQIVDSGRDAIVAQSMVSFKMNSNDIKDSVAAGIRTIDCRDGAILGNTVDGAGSKGIYSQGSTINSDGISIKDNHCIGCGTWGIFMIGSDNASVMGNTIRNRSPEFTGAHDGSANASVLTDTGGVFTIDSLVGYIIYNITDGSNGTVTANTATTVTATLSGGTDNDWDVSDTYEIHTISKTITTVGIRLEGAGNANLIVNNDVRGITTGISSTVTGTADTVTPNFT